MIEAFFRFLEHSFDTFERRWGMRPDTDEPAPRIFPCPCCKGTGLLVDSGDVCPECSGSGQG